MTTLQQAESERTRLLGEFSIGFARKFSYLLGEMFWLHDLNIQRADRGASEVYKSLEPAHDDR